MKFNLNVAENGKTLCFNEPFHIQAKTSRALMNFGLMQFFPTDETGKTAKKAKTFKVGKSNHGY